MEMTPEAEQEKLSDYSILSWVLDNDFKSEAGETLDFKDRQFLLDILTDWSQEIVFKKCSQVGGSVVFNIKCFFATMRLGWNIIYTMPTDSDVEEFVKTKTNKLILQNPNLFKNINSDSVYLKQLGNKNIYFKGTISKTAAISTSADLCIHDEVSRSDQITIETYKSRLKASKFKGRWFFSNPTTEKDVLDIKWHQSDQKEWHIICGACEAEHVMTFPESFDLEKQIYVCKECKAEISDDMRRRGRWIAMNPGKKISGYHVSHMMCPWITAEEIIEDSEGDLEYFYNFILGEPYNPGDLRVGKNTILDNWTPKDLETKEYYLGVDVGNIKHFVLGSEKGVIKVGKFSKWQDLEDMMKMYKPMLVIDALPDNTMAKYFVDKYRNAYMWFPQENFNNPQTIIWWGEKDKQGIVYTSRDRSIDHLIDRILNAEILFGLPSDKDFRDYIKHWETLRRIKEVNAKGIEKYVWESTTGEDHYVFATLYYYLARLTKGNGEFISEKIAGQYELINADGEIQDLGPAMESINEWG